MAVALGLGAALSWGLADYFAAVASRDVGALRVVLTFHLFAMVPLTALVLTTGELGRVTLGELAAFVAIGALGWISYLAFYGALAIGPISVLSPIVSGYAAVTVLLAVAFAGNHLSVVQALAVAGTIAGTMLASADLRAIARAQMERRSALGFVLALCAMALLGGFVFGVSYYHHRLGWLTPIFLARGFAALTGLCHLSCTGGLRAAEARPPGRRRLVAILMLLAVVDTGGYVCFNLGVGHGAAAIVAAASAPYALVPIAMGVSLLKERPTRAQWAGVTCVIAGVAVLGAVS